MLVRCVILFFALFSARAADPLEILRNLDLNAAPHHYYERPTKDRFAEFQKTLTAGQATLDRSSEKAFLMSLLRALEIPPSSQMLVFSTTSLQLSLISPSNPRALYFNEDTYLGFIPGGKIEVVSIDPELGGMFYILDIPKNSAAPMNIERSRRCMNCHSGSESGYVPGLVIKSVIPAQRGGTLDAFRVDLTGHSIPLSDRFGGWYLTGKHNLTNHWANAIGRPGPADSIQKELIEPGGRFSYSRYLVEASDILPQLIHEHQAGFVNRALQLGYAARALLHSAGDKLEASQSTIVTTHARELVRYILFAEEAVLPLNGIEGDAAFKSDFLANRRAHQGASLKDLDLATRLFKHRCSYMIYSPVFAALPPLAKGAVIRELRHALLGESDLSAHLSAPEKFTIRSILRATLPELRDI